MLSRTASGIDRRQGELDPQLDIVHIFAALDICFLCASQVHARFRESGRSTFESSGHLVSISLGHIAKTEEETSDTTGNFLAYSWPLLWRGVEDHGCGCVDETHASLLSRERWL